MTEDNKTKPCRYCGKTLPEEAIFCYYCRRELVTRPERPTVEPKQGSNWMTYGLIAAAVVIVIVLILLLS
ncbi:MAG: hypothetical protein CVU39_01025 [Chloroflexi bacterium HGW-Chloroflexi-10]|nr:MAG: hypothetical protein CVU39_01025 [Chloroflexi bacterium HGW-Chloroflexi-10]